MRGQHGATSETEIVHTQWGLLHSSSPSTIDRSSPPLRRACSGEAAYRMNSPSAEAAPGSPLIEDGIAEANAIGLRAGTTPNGWEKLPNPEVSGLRYAARRGTMAGGEIE